MKILYEYAGWSESVCHFVDFAMRRLIYSCGERPVKQFVVHKIYQGWITHKARIIILILNQIVLNYTHPYIWYG